MSKVDQIPVVQDVEQPLLAPSVEVELSLQLRPVDRVKWWRWHWVIWRVSQLLILAPIGWNGDEVGSYVLSGCGLLATTSVMRERWQWAYGLHWELSPAERVVRSLWVGSIIADWPDSWLKAGLLLAWMVGMGLMVREWVKWPRYLGPLNSVSEASLGVLLYWPSAMLMLILFAAFVLQGVSFFFAAFVNWGGWVLCALYMAQMRHLSEEGAANVKLSWSMALLMGVAGAGLVLWRMLAWYGGVWGTIGMVGDWWLWSEFLWLAG